MASVEKMAVAIADESAVVILNSYSLLLKVGRHRWLEPDMSLPFVRRAMRYLDLRGKLEHHPEHRHFVKVIGEKL